MSMRHRIKPRKAIDTNKACMIVILKSYSFITNDKLFGNVDFMYTCKMMKCLKFRITDDEKLIDRCWRRVIDTNDSKNILWIIPVRCLRISDYNSSHHNSEHQLREAFMSYFERYILKNLNVRADIHIPKIKFL